MTRFRDTSLSALLPKLTKPARAKRGFHHDRLLSEWPTIVGPELARRCVPQKIAYDRHGQEPARLHLQCEPAWAIDIQYMEPIILEKIAVFFGYRAIGKLILHQAPLPEKPQAKPVSDISSAPLPAEFSASLEQVTDPDIKAALTRLAKTFHTPRDT